MSDWDDYRLILALARAGTLRGAASNLGLTHTTVSRRLAIIEGARGKLFEKHPEGYDPTRLGHSLIDVAQSMESLTHAGDRYQKALDEELAGTVTISLPEPVAQYLLLEDLFELRAAFPQIDIIIEASSQFADLDRLEADIVVRGTQTPPDHLVGRRLFPNCVTYYAHRDYLAKTPHDELRWIAPPSNSLWPDWLERSPYPDAPIALVIDDIVTRYLALANGLGLGRAACFMADPIPELVRLVDDPPVPQQVFWVLTHPDLRETPRIRAVMDFITRAMKGKESLVTGRRG